MIYLVILNVIHVSLMSSVRNQIAIIMMFFIYQAENLFIKDTEQSMLDPKVGRVKGIRKKARGIWDHGYLSSLGRP